MDMILIYLQHNLIAIAIKINLMIKRFHLLMNFTNIIFDYYMFYSIFKCVIN